MTLVPTGRLSTFCSAELRLGSKGRMAELSIRVIRYLAGPEGAKFTTQSATVSTKHLGKLTKPLLHT